MKANELNTKAIVRINPEIVEKFKNQEDEMLLIKGGIGRIHIGSLNIINCKGCGNTNCHGADCSINNPKPVETTD